MRACEAPPQLVVDYRQRVEDLRVRHRDDGMRINLRDIHGRMRQSLIPGSSGEIETTNGARPGRTGCRGSRSAFPCPGRSYQPDRCRYRDTPVLAV